MGRIDIESNHGQVAQTIENNYGGGPKAPPVDHPNARRCPQCHGQTWRMTQWCVHCGADLFAIDHRAQSRRDTVRRIKVSGVLLFLGGLAIYGQRYVPDGARLWVLGFGAVAMIIAAGVLRD